MKNVDELMSPRYEQIADYPGNDIEVGEVFEPNEHFPEIYLKKYPHLFRKLSWWEHRKPEEMPEYLSHTIQGKTTYHKIICWDMSNLNYIIGYEDERNGCNLGIWAKEYTYQPATEQDYLNYLKQ